MIDKKDARWWILEAQQHPEKAADLIRMLSERMALLDQQNEQLRGELIELRRKLRGAGASGEAADVAQLKERVQVLESALHQPGAQGARQLLVSAKGQIVANIGYQAALAAGIPARDQPQADLSILVAPAAANLIAFAADARVYSIGFADLPAPADRPIALSAPGDIVAFIDQSALETCRYVVLLTERGYAYSILSGTVNRMAPQHDKVIRNLIPDDPIAAAFPTNNADLFAISRRGRWLRFPEKTIGGTGAQLMELSKNDRFASLTWLSGEAPLYFISTDGQVFSRRSQELPARRAPGKAALTLFPDREMIAIGTGPELTAITSGGHVINLILRSLPVRAESGDGATLPALPAGQTVIAAAFH